MNPLGRHFLVLRQVEQLPQSILGALGLFADHAEIVAPPADLDIQPGLEQAQVLIERSTQIREPRVVSRLEIEFPLGRRR